MTPQEVDAWLRAGAQASMDRARARHVGHGDNGFRLFWRFPIRLLRDRSSRRVFGMNERGEYWPVEFTPSGRSWRWCQVGEASFDVWDYHRGGYVFGAAVGPAAAGRLGGPPGRGGARRRVEPEDDE